MANGDRPKYLEYCKSKGIHVTAYSCLGSTDSPLYNDADLKALAAAKGRTVQQVLSVLPLSHCQTLTRNRLMWGIQRGTSVIPKSVTESRIKANFELDGWELSPAEVARVDGLKGRFKVCGDEWLPHGVKVFFGDDE